MRNILFFFSRIVLTILISLSFHKNFRIVLFIFTKILLRLKGIMVNVYVKIKKRKKVEFLENNISEETIKTLDIK